MNTRVNEGTASGGYYQPVCARCGWQGTSYSYRHGLREWQARGLAERDARDHDHAHAHGLGWWDPWKGWQQPLDSA
jgi:hypothetical protein